MTGLSSLGSSLAGSVESCGWLKLGSVHLAGKRGLVASVDSIRRSLYYSSSTVLKSYSQYTSLSVKLEQMRTHNSDVCEPKSARFKLSNEFRKVNVWSGFTQLCDISR